MYLNLLFFAVFLLIYYMASEWLRKRLVTSAESSAAKTRGRQMTRADALSLVGWD